MHPDFCEIFNRGVSQGVSRTDWARGELKKVKCASESNRGSGRRGSEGMCGAALNDTH